MKAVMQALRDEMDSSSSDEDEETSEHDAEEPELDAEAVEGMTVVKLRNALESRGKDSTGLKAELKARLLECIDSQSPTVVLMEDLTGVKVPKPAEPVVLSANGCAYGASCISTSPTMTLEPCAMCGIGVHHMCMTSHVLLGSWIGGRPNTTGINESKVCLDCALLCGVVQKKVGMNLVEQYTKQVAELPKPTPRVVTTLLTSKSLKFWTHASNDLCETCNMGGDLLSCSYCNVSYHNDAPCLDESQVIAASLRNSELYEWPCPNFKDAVDAHKRKGLVPNTTAGENKKRRK